MSIDYEPRRPPTEAERQAYRDAYYRAPVVWRGGDWRCTCGLDHAEPWECLTPDEVTAWRTRHPEATCRERVARPLAWLERTFGR